VGDTNDAIGVYIQNKMNPVYKPYAIRAASPLTKAMVYDMNAPTPISKPGMA